MTGETNPKEGGERHKHLVVYIVLITVILLLVIGLSIYFSKRGPSQKEHFEQPCPAPQVMPTDRQNYSETFVDLHQEFKDIATNFVTTTMFSEPSGLFAFLDDIQRGYTRALHEFRELHRLEENDLFFIFKGGGIIRILWNRFIHKFPELVESNLELQYAPYFKRSDADFSIFLRPTIPNFEAVRKDLDRVVFEVQRDLRERLYQDPRRYFGFFKYSHEVREIMMKPYLEKMQNAAALQDPSNTIYFGASVLAFSILSTCVAIEQVPCTLFPYQPRKDFRVRYTNEVHTEEDVHTPEAVLLVQDNYQVEEIATPSFGPYSWIYISDNRALDFKKHEEQIHFDLIRSKVNTNMVVQLPGMNPKIATIGGELIDVSIPRDDSAAHFFADIETNLSTYDLKLSPDTEPLRFVSYSLEYFIYDLFHILFGTPELDIESIEHARIHLTENDDEAESLGVGIPWVDNKYEKRLARLCFLCFMDAYAALPSLAQRKQILLDFINKLVALRNGPPQTIEYGNFVTDYGSMLGFSKLYHNVILVTQYVHDHPEESENYKKFIEIILNNCFTLLTAFSNLEYYLLEKGAVVKKDLYDGSFSSLF